MIGLLHDYALDVRPKYNMLEEKDQVAFVPITTMQRRLVGTDQIDELNVEVDKTDNLGRLVEEINSIPHRHPSRHPGFQSHTARRRASRSSTPCGPGFYMVGCGVGAVTLMLVGGIGIMNLMLASINERVREIGIRRSDRRVEPRYLRPIHGRGQSRSVCAGRIGLGVAVKV